MSKFDENPVNAQEAASILKISISSISALKRSMGIKSRKIFVSDLRKYLRNNPTWTAVSVYHSSQCVCITCQQKRAARRAAQEGKSRGSSAATGSCAATTGGLDNNFHAPATPPASQYGSEPSFRLSVPQASSTPSATADALGPKSDDLSREHRGKVRSGLGQKLRFLRGKRSAKLIADQVGLSRESIFRIERGDPVKLCTVQKIAAALGATRGERLELTKEWLLQVGGDDARELRIELMEEGIIDYTNHFDAQLAALRPSLEQLSIEDREQLIKVLERRELIKGWLNLLCLLQSVRDVEKPGKP